MPWGVGKRDSCPASKPWAVYLQAGGKVVGCHPTRERALAHQRALYAQESAAYPLGKEPVMREHLIAPVLEWKAAGDSGELEGYVSVFGNVDLGGDVVLPGAFRKTLADWSRSKQPLPLIVDHDLSTEGVIGSVKQAKEDGIGLWVRAGFASTAKAQDTRTKMVEGHLRGMSFTYETVKHYVGEVAGKSARFLQELRLFEATVTPFPMNTLALASAKTDTSAALDFDVFAASMRAALGIGFEPARKAAVDLLAASYHPEDFAAGTPDEEPTAAAAAPEGTAEPDPRAYALGFIASPPEPPDGALNPLAALETARANADLDRVEASILNALGRAAQ